MAAKLRSHVVKVDGRGVIQINCKRRYSGLDACLSMHLNIVNRQLIEPRLSGDVFDEMFFGVAFTNGCIFQFVLYKVVEFEHGEIDRDELNAHKEHASD